MSKCLWVFMIVGLFPESPLAQQKDRDSTLGERDALLKIDDFSPASGRISMDYGLSYNSQDHSGYVPDFVHILSPEGSVIFVPGLRATGDRTDTATVNLGIRYNVASRFNVSAQVAGGYRHGRATTAYETSDGASSFDASFLSLGTDFRLPSLGSRGSANAFFSFGAIEKNSDQFYYGKQFTAGLTGYWTIDPLILSTALSYSKFLERKTESGSFHPGDVVSISPTVGFAVSPDINLSWGMTFAFKGGDEVNEHNRTDWEVLSTVNLGLGYRLGENKLLSIRSRAGVGGNNGVQISSNISHRF